MKKAREPIIVKATCVVGDRRVDVDTLTAEQRKRLATAIRVTMLNEQFAGRVHFFPAANA